MVPQSLSCTPVTADPGPAAPSYDVNAAFMSFQPHEGGIHAVWPGSGEASVTEVRFRCVLWPVARRERTAINLG
jgi:hypothetical protein